MQSKSFSKIVISIFMLFCSSSFYGQNSTSNNSQSIVYTSEQQKIRVENQNVKLIADKENGGYHLYVKKSPNVNSILLTETTKDPTGKNDSYAYRSKEYNKINGDEKRILNGEFLVSEGAKYSLVDSTPEETDFFGPAFHIYIPQTLVYGYEWSRNGEIQIDKGTFINIRSFEKPYADYTGNYVDNPFMFDFVKIKKPKPKKVVKELPPPPVIEDVPVEEETEFNIIKTKTFTTKPMSNEEAILQMNLLGHTFFVYKNSETEQNNIVYKRKDGNYGVIEIN